ncbi:MAG: TIGR01906 family membrane protein [SAR202 cluster bacterium]|nr:TIGR01906 family membrane protein [SAR202 cluster bacterium]
MKTFKTLKIFANILFILSIPIFLITTNTRLLINSPFIYSIEFNKMDIPSKTNIKKQELLSISEQIRYYFNNNQDYLNIETFINGIKQPLFNDREIAHMFDVKKLVKTTYSTQLITGFLLLLIFSIDLIFRKKTLKRNLLLGSSLTIGGILLIGIGILFAFDQIFILFHQLSFTNDLWILDPNKDYLIKIFNPNFFYDSTVYIAIATIVEALIIIILIKFIKVKQSK